MKILKNALLILFLICFQCCCSTTFNVSISPHQYLKDGDVLVSGSGRFELGFFSPGNSDRRYLGIWFRDAVENTIVWVANRDSPINDSSGFLSIKDHGNLVILCGKQSSPVWSSNVSTAAAANVSSTATLLDTGNLVLFHSDKKTVLWQSFDIPTHTLLPSMKLGLDLKTGLNRYLTSWKSPDDPGTGNFAYRMNSSGFPQFFLLKERDPVWRTGPWNGMRWSGVPEMSNRLPLYRETVFVKNDDEIYVTINTIDRSVWSRFVMDVSGSVEMFTWSDADPRWNKLFSAPVDQCDHYDLCGAYSSCNPYNPNVFVCHCLPGYEPKSPRNWSVRDGSEGCVRKRLKSPTCDKGDGFVKMVRVKLPDTSKARYNMSMSLKDCKEECLRNCSCKAYANADIREGGTGCATWHGDLMDIREYLYMNGGQDLYVRVDASEQGNYDKEKSHHKWMIMAIVATFVALFLIFVISFVYCIVKKRRKGKRDEQCSTHFPDLPMSKELLQNQTNSDLPFYCLDTIVDATNNFSLVNKLGEGGFGSVYKGILSNGQEIAVKRLSKSSGQGTEEFKNEVMLIAKLQHRNLVRLFGCCIQKEEKMLVYEYLPNNSLDSIIFDETNKSLLDWRKRFEIICGIARGILYLHEDSRLRIIHRDLKASNVLLDATLNPKISDFGMARIFGVDQISANTNRVVGTYGYMSPEYAMEGLFSVKSDVYSFGVLLLEIVAGRKNSSFIQQSSSNLIGHIWNLWKEGKELDIVDESLLGDQSYCVEEVLRCIRIGLLCVQESASDRPTMFTVLFMLGNEAPVASPKQPAFILRKSFSNADPSTASDGSSSITANALTVTMHEGR